MQSSAGQLIKEMLSDEQGAAYQLLQHYFSGLPIESLTPLLCHKNSYVRKGAMFIASELGEKVQILIDSIAPLVHDLDKHTAWYAMESILLCASGAYSDRFIAVVGELDNNAEPLRRLAMRLISKGNRSQLEGAKRRCEELGDSASIHEECLQTLIDGDRVESNAVRQMLDSNNQLVRFYGAIAANRLRWVYPELLDYAASNTNPDVKRFATEALEGR
jgi:hypothetical protein